MSIAPLPYTIMTEKVANCIPIEEYDPEKHDFDEYFDLLGNAVGLATNTSKDRRDELTVQWVPLKLNEQTRMIFNSCKEKTWDKLRPEFKELLKDPHDAYRWKIGQITVKWDGKQSFNEYAMRVKRTVDTYENPAKETDYFHLFRKGLPRDYAKAIDLGRMEETLEEAKRVAMRYQAALENEKSDAVDPVGTLAFTGASMYEEGLPEERLEAIEQGLERLSVKVDNISKDMNRLFNRVDDLVEQLHRSRSDRPSRHVSERESYERRYRDEQPDSRDHDDYHESRHHGRRDGRHDHKDTGSHRDRHERRHNRDNDEEGEQY